MSTTLERTPSRMESSIVPELVLDRPSDRPDRIDRMGSLPGSEPIRTARDPATGRCRIEIDRVGRFRFTAGAPEVHALPAPGTCPATVRAAYLATVLPLALQAAGHQLLHASAIDTPEGVIAFCGPSGAGKSTLAAALARRGHPQWADDAVWWEIVTDERGEPIGARTRRLPFQRRLRPDAERWLGIDRQEQADGGDVGNTSLRRLRPLRAAYLLASRSNEPGSPPPPAPLRLIRALPALLDNAYHFEVGKRSLGDLAEAYLALAVAVPVVRLVLPHDLDRLARAVERLVPILANNG